MEVVEVTLFWDAKLKSLVDKKKFIYRKVLTYNFGVRT
jgi:hypothetical protein